MMRNPFKLFVLSALSALLCSATAFAAEGGEIEEMLPPEVGVFEFQSIDLHEFVGMLKVMNIRAQTGSQIGNKHYLRFESAEDVARAREIAARIDVPFKNIALNMQLILAADESRLDIIKKNFGIPVAEKPIGGDVYSQLQGIFKYPIYRLLSNFYTVAKSGQQVEMGLEGLEGKTIGRELFDVDVRPIFIDEGQGIIRLEGLEIDRIFPDPERDLLETTLNIKNGETVIVGGANIGGNTYVVVVRAEVVE